jgi:hypothetical protein
MNCLECGAVVPGAGTSCPNCRPKRFWHKPVWLAVTVGAALFVAAFVVRNMQGDEDEAVQAAEARRLCDELGPQLRNKPGAEALNRLGQPIRRAQHNGYEAWVYAGPQGGRFAVYIYSGKVSHVTTDLPAD